MPNRILRDWTDSEKINELSVHAERFFTRLIMKADDNGCFNGNPKLLLASLYPLILDDVTDIDIKSFIEDCEKVGLLKTYLVKGKPYIQITDFRQRLRNKVSRFPLPSDTFETSETLKKGDVILHQENQVEILAVSSKHGAGLSLIDTYFADLPNSTHLENIAKTLNVDKAQLLKALPEFRKSANLSYPNGVKFAEHFKNWYLKRKTTSNTDTPIKAGYTPKI